MFPDPGEDWRPRLRRLLLDVDARIDSAIFQSGKWTREIYERFTAFMDRAHVAGWRRWLLVEPLSEAATLGTGGLFLLLVLAIPSFRQTSDDDWLKKSDLAVTFLDRYGNEVGSRGIKHTESVPLEEFPDHLIKAVLAVLRTFRHRYSRRVPRFCHQYPSGRRRSGRLHHNAAAGEEFVPLQRAHL
jgi:penicillin-binding protein 1A